MDAADLTEYYHSLNPDGTEPGTRALDAEEEADYQWCKANEPIALIDDSEDRDPLVHRIVVDEPANPYHPRPDLDPPCTSRGAPRELERSLLRMERLLGSDPGCVRLTDRDGWGAHHLAVFTDKPQMARMLVESGADVNQEEWTRGHTPLHLAVICPYPNVTAVHLLR